MSPVAPESRGECARAELRIYNPATHSNRMLFLIISLFGSLGNYFYQMSMIEIIPKGEHNSYVHMAKMTIRHLIPNI